ncbi:unnamed protein product [Urochloa decumbens]|uniref:Uncharacterized protein n=1 Tax=Urochloa decumbens TaxID=240449 RepID=A0ABC9HB56_9POAL
MGSSSLLLFPSSSSAASASTAAAYSTAHATTSSSLLPPLPSQSDHLLLQYLHHLDNNQQDLSSAAAMVRKRPAPDMDLPPPRRHVTGDLSDVTAAAAGAPPQSAAGSAQLPALPTQLHQLPPPAAFQHHAEVEAAPPPPAPAGDAGSNTTTAWVDGIIRDIIGSSGGAGVSIAQLIHNVREIIHPCNPGLASLLELRLREIIQHQQPTQQHPLLAAPPPPPPPAAPALPPPPQIAEKRPPSPPNASPPSPKPPTAEETAAAVAVHWLHHSLYDVTGNDSNTLWLIQRLAPKVVTMVEQDLSHSGSFLARFVEAIHYYSALFDSLDASYGEDSAERHVVEQQLLSREIRNVLAVGGPARSGDVKFASWREQLAQAGFRAASLAGSAAAQASLLLGMFPSDGYTLVEENGALKLGWKDLCLLTASAWRPIQTPCR